MSDEQQIEVSETTEAAPVVKELPTREEVIKERGWSAAEADSAEKHGMLRKPEPPKETPVEKPVAKAPAPVAPVAPQDRRRNVMPEINLTPEVEAKLKEILPPGTNVHAFYVGMKNERAQKQRWRQEAEQWKAKAEEAARSATRPASEAVPAVDANGQPVVDDDDKPLTMRQIREMQEKNRVEMERQQKEVQARAQIVAEAQEAHEASARASYPDFESTAALAKDLIENLDAHYPAGKERKRVEYLYSQFLDTIKRSHELSEDDFNEADLAYELGKLHPNYGKSSESTPSEATTDGTQPEIDPSKANGGHTPEKLQRIEKNTQRRVSSAAIPAGGGKKTVSASDVTLEMLNRMPSSQRDSFKQKYPDRYRSLLRG